MPVCECCGDIQPEPLYKLGQKVLHPKNPRRWVKIRRIRWSHCYKVWEYEFDLSKNRGSLSESKIIIYMSV